jgi:ATPase subunit of ABC transporter with duplicated ATPase domains
MKSFKGTIIFVSHDRYFINNIANKIVEVANEKISMYDGNYDMYKHKDDVVEENIVQKQIRVKPPKISKGGKW